MALSALSGSDLQATERVLRDELSRADRALHHIGPILRHLLSNEDHIIFGDDVIARVRGMLADLERQIVRALDDAAGFARPAALIGEGGAGLADALGARPTILHHLHMLALEWQLTERWQARLGIDPVLTPVMQEFVASTDPDTAARGMNLLAAQARFGQAIRRMQLPLAELPPDLHEQAIDVMHAAMAGDPVGAAASDEAAVFLRTARKAHMARVDLLEQAVASSSNGACDALTPTDAGAALFVTALGLRCGIGRDDAIMATTESQIGRLRLMLAAAALPPQDAAAIVVTLHPDIGQTGADIDGVDPALASDLLASALDRAEN